MRILRPGGYINTAVRQLTEELQLMKAVSLIIGITAIVTSTSSRADVLRCKIEGYNESVYITTSPDTNLEDGQFARIGVVRGIGNKAMVFADPMGAVAFVELNADGTPVGLLTVQKDMRVIKTRQSIDPYGMVFGPSQSGGVCARLR
jgi:hypothetical protein